MRRSSTTVSGPATVLLRRYGEKLLKNNSDSTRPRAPATSRKIPTPRLKAARLLQDASTVDRSPSPTCTGHLVRLIVWHCRYGFLASSSKAQGICSTSRLACVHL